MRRDAFMKSLLALSLLPFTCAAVLAQDRPPTEPKVQHTVIEDDHVRIEELRVRGQVQRILNRYADWVSKSAQAPVPPSPSE